MKCLQIRNFLLVVLLGCYLTACGDQTTDQMTQSEPSQTAAVDVREYSSVSNGASGGGYGDKAGGYGNQNVIFLFIFAYLFSPVLF